MDFVTKIILALFDLDVCLILVLPFSFIIVYKKHDFLPESTRVIERSN